MTYPRFTLVICLMLCPVLAVGQPADSLFQAGDFAGAAQAYAARLKAHPDDARGWFRLGMAHHQQAHYREALLAWEKAEETGFPPAFTRYNRAAALARLGDADGAIDWLGRAIEAGFSQVQTLQTDDDLAPLRKDARFQALVEAADRKARPCLHDEHRRQFDFWIGTWDVHTSTGQLAGTNTIEAVEQGCVLRENWTGQSGGTGTSYNFYDPTEQAWKQLWVDAQGNHALFTGHFVDGAMRFEGTWVNADGTTSLMTMTFTPLDDGRVRQYFEQSTDGGATWKTWFDGYYSRRD